jgi:Thiamin pyrophosphokinase, vitamin B1 binding domain
VCVPYEGPTCGLIPLAGPSTITTQGLKWDVEAWDTALGGRVSTNNCVEGVCEACAFPATELCTHKGEYKFQRLVRVHSTASIVWTINVNAKAFEE